MHPNTLEDLDDYELGYDHLPVTVIDASGQSVEATAYIGRLDRIVTNGTPSDDYLAKILRGAREHNLPESYIESIQAAALGNALS